MSEWVSVKERLPKEDGRYMVYIVCEKYRAWIGMDKLIDGVFGLEEITHWMPVPSPPK